MPPTLQELGIQGLSVEDRLALADAIRDSVAAELEERELTVAQRIELDRRLSLADANPDRGVPWEVVRAEARARWGK